ncbi:MAG: VOC family protein, partial [Bacteroidetes bacterium]|nr:VOC family protein [Bacteroidota bacterium]
FEIPVTDMDRAIDFYQTVFKIDINKANVGNEEMAFFASKPENPGISGALIRHEHYKPSKNGVVIYFASADVSTELNRVEAAGGKVIKPKTLITEEIGHCGAFIDSEGNQVAIYCRP